MSDLILEYDAFLRSFRQNRDVEHAFLLGAGASIESGISSAEDCIWEWKKDIFISKHPHLTKQYSNIKSETVREAIQRWIDSEGIYPELNSDEKYSFYAEKAYPIEEDRQKFFQNIISGKKPSLGYHLLMLLAEKRIVTSVWTTNFDDLIIKAAHINNISPIEITLDSQERIYRPISNKELICVFLHGDYKYGYLKNTATELDAQSEIFIKALKEHLKNRHLIVIGYSGRDKSLMNALKEAYSERGAGRLYWLGYGNYISPKVKELILHIREQGREVFFVPTDGFDRTMLNLTTTIFQDSIEDLEKISKIKSNFKQIEKQFSPFKYPVGDIQKLVKSNLSPIAFPKEVFQFEINIKEPKKTWELCKEATVNANITAIYYKGMIYAFGTKDEIYQYFKKYLKSDVSRTPIDREEIKGNSAFKNLILKTLVKLFAKINNLSCDFNNKIWDTSQKMDIKINNKIYKVYSAIKLYLFFDKEINYIAILPSFNLADSNINNKVKREISRQYYLNLYQRKPNINFNNYIAKWKNILFGSKEKLSFEFPLNSGSNFKFVVSKKSLYVGIIQTQNKSGSIRLPSNILDKQIRLKGIKYPDTELIFYNPKNKQHVTDFHPMRGLVKNQPFDYYLNNTVLSPEVNLGIICPYDYANELYSFLNLLNSRVEAKRNPDYLIDYPGFLNVFGIPINIPSKESDLWFDYNIEDSGDLKKTAQKLANTIISKIERLDNNLVNIIFIPEALERFTRYKDGVEIFDLHDYIKAFAVQKGISTQLIREKTIKSNLKNQIIWWLSLALYVKSLRTPWILSNLDKTTAFAGLGFSLRHSVNKEKILLGCSHIYTSEGQGLKYRLSKITDFKLDRKNNPFLSESEAYQLGINIRELFLKSVGELPKRVVIHKRTYFTEEEIKGLTESLKYTDIEDVDLIEINFERAARFIAVNSYFKIDNFPVSRGLCFPVFDNTAFLFTHGIARSIRDPRYRYFKGGTSLPVPLKIKKHYGNGDIGTIATEILGLTKMNWNSFDLYSKLPCTVQSSNEIARIGWLLSHIEGQSYDYRYFM